jgi:hypothetical protein
MKQKLFIPKTIKVGFQNRKGTYTGRLAYVIYFDQTGKLRKEVSWNSWRDNKIDPVEADNVPTEGFVLNKKAGGLSYSRWNSRNTYIRVHDPRGFEFEISVANLLFILSECDCNKGKGLEGKFVYAWEGTELVLLPVGTEEYREANVFTDLSGQKIKTKDLTVGATYKNKDMEDLLYMGRHKYYFCINDYDYSGNPDKQKKNAKGWCSKHIFHDGEKFRVMDTHMMKLAAIVTEEWPDNYAELVDELDKLPFMHKVVKIFLEKAKDDKVGHRKDYSCSWPWWTQRPDGAYYKYETNYVQSHWLKDYEKEGDVVSCQTSRSCVWVDADGKLQMRRTDIIAEPPNTTPEHSQCAKYRHLRHHSYYEQKVVEYIEETGLVLYAELDNGQIVEFDKLKINGGTGRWTW